MDTDRDDRLEERLLLRKAVAFEFCGLVDGVGFMVLVALHAGVEFWGLVRHYGDPHDRSPAVGTQVCILAEREDVHGTLTWVPWDWSKGILIEGDWNVKDVEDEREALTLALDLCDGKIQPVEPDPFVAGSLSGMGDDVFGDAFRDACQEGSEARKLDMRKVQPDGVMGSWNKPEPTEVLPKRETEFPVGGSLCQDRP